MTDTNPEPTNIIYLPVPPTHEGFTVLAIGSEPAPDGTLAHLLQGKSVWRVFRVPGWIIGQDVWVKRVDSEGKILAWHELGVTVNYLIE